MSKSFRVNPTSGEVEVMIHEEGGPIYLGAHKRFNEGKMMHIHQLYDPIMKQMIWMLDGIRINLLTSIDDDNQISYVPEERRERDTRNILCEYSKPVLLIINAIDAIAFLTDIKGNPLSGSNIYETGNLCLGQVFNPYIAEPLDLMLYNHPNNDLNWYGEPIREIEKEANKEGETPITTIKTWPAKSEQQITLSQQTKDAIMHFLS